MASTQAESLTVLYEQDETAWLEAMAQLVAQRRYAELDHLHLSEFLADIAKRDRREVFSRLVILMSNLLKWQHQPDRRSGSGRGTIREQGRELRGLLESDTLRNHAQSVLLDAYAEARKQASDETEQSLGTFPLQCTWGLDDLLSEE